MEVETHQTSPCAGVNITKNGQQLIRYRLIYTGDQINKSVAVNVKQKPHELQYEVFNTYKDPNGETYLALKLKP